MTWRPVIAFFHNSSQGSELRSLLVETRLWRDTSAARIAVLH
uniref:Uncharacterized protein n=1 Tax=Anguilla anguilla TaxID=7936 RepID=A0A0E9U7J7_ANGAN